MGQYYKPISINKGEHLYSHEYDEGLKLMEHSYIGNDFVGAVETLIMPDGAWRGDNIIWAGDYADPVLDESGNPLMSDDGKYEMNHYSLLEETGKIKPPAAVPPKEFKYLVNHTKKEFCDKTKASKVGWSENLRIHPLPLLTADGNNRGGGDYRPNNEKDEALVGSWKGDVVTLDKEMPKGFNEIDISIFKEG